MTVPTTLSTWDYVSLSITLVISTFVGFYQVFKGKKSRDTKEFLVAERNIGFFPVVLSTIATAISPIAMQAFPLEMYVSGIQFVLTTVGPFLTMPVFAYIFLPVYYNLGISSVFQVF